MKLREKEEIEVSQSIQNVWSFAVLKKQEWTFFTTTDSEAATQLVCRVSLFAASAI